MTRAERIKQIANDIAKKDCYLYDKCPKEPKHNCISQDPEIMLESSKHYVTIATWLSSEGYQKIVWHKVVDGTWKFIPRDMMLLFVIQYEDINTREMIKQVIPGSIDSESNCCHLHCASSKDTPNNRNTEGIIAWTELPSYED